MPGHLGMQSGTLDGHKGTLEIIWPPKSSKGHSEAK
jgi:hypothetical protein